ncbi:hypothetical protein [Alkalihalobacterium bogoriense]|uniref:hypothetical protein n=1 Tax=Alkalihalobacterium bogoriense TaxID=246272 RepID=UPI00248197ED|nr:hypothetical protein [Alkalihalobacterium bogoriense]
MEIFFKWVKQHLRLVKLQSTKPQGIWNQILFVMTAYCLVLYIKKSENTSKTLWRTLRFLRLSRISFQSFTARPKFIRFPICQKKLPRASRQLFILKFRLICFNFPTCYGCTEAIPFTTF